MEEDRRPKAPRHSLSMNNDLDTSPLPREIRDEPANRAKHLSFVAHEIRNPLATALWSAELLSRLPEGERGGPRGDKLAKMCVRAVARVRRLLEDHLLAERLDVAGVPVSREPVAVAELLPADAVAIGVSALAADVEAGLLAFTDPQLARRAIEALLVVAGRGNHEVRLAAKRVASVARVEVAGTPATPRALLDRLPGDNEELGPGCLGLGMARRLAAALGGTLSVEGGAFVLELPAAEPGARTG